MRPAVALLLSSLAAVALTGCTAGSARPDGGADGVTLTDAFDRDIIGPHVNDLHSPYLAGASFPVSVTTRRERDATGWTLSSSDPDVVRVVTPLEGGLARVTAGNPGRATLSVLDRSGAVLASHAVTVATPDEAILYAEGLLLTGAPDSLARLARANIVAGSEATFLVRYFAHGVELSGGGAAQATATNGVTVTTASTSVAPARDFVRVSVPTVGASASVSLALDGVVVSEVPITEVAPSAVARVSVVPQSTDAAENGDLVALYAHAVDATSADVYGAHVDWFVNGDVPEGLVTDGPADLFFYSFDSAGTQTVTASCDPFSASTTVSAPGSRAVSTASAGCTLTGATRGYGGPFSLAAIALAAAGVARRGRRRDPRRNARPHEGVAP
jgi:hypothetical protein